MAGNGEIQKVVEGTEPPGKKQKTADEEGCDLENLSAFQTERILSCDSRSKTIVALGKIAERAEAGGAGERALVILEKKPFEAESFEKICTQDTLLKKVFRNDVYGNYDCFVTSDLNAVKATIIHPASDKHVQKYESQLIHVVEETPELYQSVTLPYVEKGQLNLQWVYNILEHKSEVDRIVTEDLDPETGFVLVPDLKWDGKDMKSLYLLAIVRKTGIKSLRDMTGDHLPLLKNILNKCMNVIEEKYKLPSSRIRAFLHYQPTFYHLHVHFTYLQYDSPGIHTERAHMLTTVINNITLLPNYYQTATLPFTVKQTDRLFSVLSEKGNCPKAASP